MYRLAYWFARARFSWARVKTTPPLFTLVQLNRVRGQSYSNLQVNTCVGRFEWRCVQNASQITNVSSFPAPSAFALGREEVLEGVGQPGGAVKAALKAREVMQGYKEEPVPQWFGTVCKAFGYNGSHTRFLKIKAVMEEPVGSFV